MNLIKTIVSRKPLILIALLLSFFVVSRAFAQTTPSTLNVTVSPPVFDLTALPGDNVKQTFRLRNNGDTPLDLQVSARRLISDPTTGNPTPETSPTGEELSWVSFDPSSFTAPAREWTNVNFTIKVPSTAAYGYYYVFSITPKGASTQKTTGANIKGELLVVTLLNVKKAGAISKAELVNFSPTNFVSQYLPVTFNTVVKNTGNVHVKPRGNIFITRGGNKDLAVLDVNAAIGSVLPGGKRTFQTDWNDGFLVQEPVLEDGTPKMENGKPVTHLMINWNNLTHFRIGPYTARLLLVYDDGTRDQTIEGTTTFWVIPYMALGVILVGLLIVYFVIRMLLRGYIRSQIKRGGR